MNPNYGKTGTSLNNFDFDLGIGSNRSRSLNDQKNKPNSYGSSYSSPSSYSRSGARSGMGTVGTAPSWQPNKPSWTPQPAPARTTIGARSELGGPPSMVGDIFGKSWNSVAPAKTGGSVGMVNKDPHLFGDLVSSALGQNKSNGNAPLKSAAPASGPAKSSFSMGNMADSLPRASEAAKGSGSSWGASEKFGSFVGASSTGSTYGANGMNKSMNFGGPSVQGSGSIGGSGAIGGGAIGGSGSGLGVSSKKDPFGSLFDLGAKPSGGASLNSAGKANSTTSSEDYGFGDFKNASMSGASMTPPNAFSYSNSTSMESNQSRSQPSGSDSFDMFFSPSTGSGVGAKATPEQSGNQQSSGGDDWGFDSEFGGGGHDVGSTTELDGLPPPPAGVSASSAKSKGLDNYKQGQYADAIKWLSWALILLQKTGDANGTTEVLICRASCYKEVGEYKKAVADCTLVLEHDGDNVAVLVQRALLYESMEKYKLGAEDLRTVMKLDPANRVARSTIHRLTKMID